jgi:HK97 family phage major capsid protein
MSDKLKVLQNRIADNLKAKEALNDSLDDDHLEFSAEQQTEWDALDEATPKIQAALTREVELETQRNSVAAVQTFHPNGPPADPAAPNVVADESSRPFASFGEQMQAIRFASLPGATIDPRLMGAALGGSAGVPSDAGFLIQKEFAVDIFARAFEEAQLASRCDRMPIGEGKDGAEVVTLDDGNSRTTGNRFGGVRVYRVGETETPTKSKPKIRKWKLDLEDMAAVMYASDRMLEDAPLMDSVYRTAISREFSFVIDDEIYRGTGVGQCLGLKTSGVTITVDKESGQAAKTIVYENINNMWARMWARSRFNSVWFINQDVEPQLNLMTIPVGTGGVPAYLPPSGASSTPFATIFGRPVIPIEHADTLGTKGDICLADMSEYGLIEKDGLKTDVSMHVQFLTFEQTFRFKMRINGKPKWSSALTPYKGTNTLSPFIMLQAR